MIEKRHSNMMNPENLAIVFAPTLMRCPELDPMASLMAAKFEHKAMDIILEHQKELLKLWYYTFSQSDNHCPHIPTAATG